MNLIISLGAQASDAHPQRVSTSWADFVAWLYQHPRTQSGVSPAEYAQLSQFPSKSPEGQRLHDDKSGPYVALADFGGGKRSLDTLVHSCGIPLDFDSGSITAETIAATLAGYAYAAYTTYSHQTGAERWRVLVPTAQPMDAGSHYATWAQLSSAFVGGADPAAKDPSRLSYLPGKCLDPSAARIFHADGALFAPAPAPAPTPLALQGQVGNGPVSGWSGPLDDETLLAIACSKRHRPDERFGGPIHFAMLWSGNEEWLAAKFPPSHNEQGQAFSRTQADMALAGELAYWLGNNRERMADLMRRSGLARPEEDWQARKVYLAVDRAIANATQWHFMSEVPPAPPAAAAPAMGITLSEDGVAMTAPPSAADAALANAPPSINDYFSYHPTGEFIHRPSGGRAPATVVDNVIGKDARAALYNSSPVHSLTWAPGYPERFTLDKLDPTYVDGDVVWLYNEYRAPHPPTIEGDVSPWLDLIRRLYPDDVDHIVNYFADAVQSPQHKCNHALVLGSGIHGIGKDTLLAPLQYGVGSKNFRTIKPPALAESFNPYVRSVVVQVSESRDLGEGHHGLSRYDMYERCKDLAAAPPSALDCNEKHKGQYPVANVLRLIITTNYQVDGLYIDPNDRRHYCAWSDAPKMTEGEAAAIWHWYDAGGREAVAYYLAHLDLPSRGWNRTSPPLRTEWWHQLVEGGRPVEDDKFHDALDKLARPEWLTLPMLAEAGGLELAGWISHLGNGRKVERELVKSGYQRLPNPDEPNRGRWYVQGVRTTIYRRSDVPAKTLLAMFRPPA